MPPQAMEWCENHDVDYVFGFAGNDVLHALTREAADAICVQRALSGEDKMSRLQGFSLRRKDLGPGAAFCGPHRGDAQGSGCPLCRHLAQGGARHLYETLYCARGNAENLIKLHKSQLASDRTSCRDPKPTSSA